MEYMEKYVKFMAAYSGYGENRGQNRGLYGKTNGSYSRFWGKTKGSRREKTKEVYPGSEKSKKGMVFE